MKDREILSRIVQGGGVRLAHVSAQNPSPNIYIKGVEYMYKQV